MKDFATSSDPAVQRQLDRLGNVVFDQEPKAFVPEPHERLDAAPEEAVVHQQQVRPRTSGSLNCRRRNIHGARNGANRTSMGELHTIDRVGIVSGVGYAQEHIELRCDHVERLSHGLAGAGEAKVPARIVA